MSTITLPPVPAPASNPPAAPPRSPATGITPRRWTLDEYRELGKKGFLDGFSTILIDGEILIMPNPGTLHDATLTKAYRFLNGICPGGNYARNQQSFDVGTRNDPMPDIALVPGTEDDYLTLPPTTALLIVEVAAASLSFDTTTKAELYATAGVPEYWVIDIEHRQLLVFRDPHPLPAGLGATAYKAHLTLEPTDPASPLFAPTAAVLVSELLPRQ